MTYIAPYTQAAIGRCLADGAVLVEEEEESGWKRRRLLAVHPRPLCAANARAHIEPIMKGATTVAGFKRSLESTGQQHQQHVNGGVRPTGERRRIPFVRPRNPENGFQMLSQGTGLLQQHQQQHGKVRGP